MRMRASMAQAIVRVDTKKPAAVPASGRCVKHPGLNELAAGRREPPRGLPANPEFTQWNNPLIISKMHLLERYKGLRRTVQGCREA